ncbi:hypothetical protein F444_04206 [Phytophthora nicotianae P1976]|uniref:Uncharacterized protein n=1 Tax=Phytophthora nicotianae P1976 TaxID=1317066 RepID=A0A081ARI6_PHYNI|nr:hypothetical protein F444_04206 [Phytophthora nicotianae P1976]
MVVSIRVLRSFTPPVHVRQYAIFALTSYLWSTLWNQLEGQADQVVTTVGWLGIQQRLKWVPRIQRHVFFG